MTHKIWYWAGIALVAVLAAAATGQAFGHGIGYELLPPVWLGERQVSLEITSSRYEDVDNPDREIRFVLMDTESKVTVRDVTYGVSAYKGNVHLFDGEFATRDGILVFSFEYEDAETYLKDQAGGFLSSILGTDEKTVGVFGREFDAGGLYRFEIGVLGTGKFPDGPSPPVSYSVGISMPQRTEWFVEDPNFGKKRTSTVTYYDVISNFAYEPTDRTVSFSMPFEWSAENVNETSVVHAELVIEKSFGDLLVSSYEIMVNGMAVPKETVTVDDFAREERIVHVVLSQKTLFELEGLLRGQDVMDIEIRPAEGAVSSTVTENGQFRVDLWWEPKSLGGGEAVFYFEIKDIFLKDRQVEIPYRIEVAQDEREILVQEGTSSGAGPSSVRAVIPADLSGPALVRFENLDGSPLARADLPVIIDRKAQVLVPQWVKQTAGWWSEGKVGDGEFVAGIAYLVRNGIISVSAAESGAGAISSVPQWVKQTAGWWSEGKVGDGEFVAGIAYLISVGIITV